MPATGLTTNTCVHSRKILLIFIRSFNKQVLSAFCPPGQTQAPSPSLKNKNDLPFKRAQAVSSTNLGSKVCSTALEEPVLTNRTS